LFEVIIGIQADAPRQTLRWTPPEAECSGVRNLPLGLATVSAAFRPEKGRAVVDVETDRPITIDLTWKGRARKFRCKPGKQRVEVL